jgi:hypothetical protein
MPNNPPVPVQVFKERDRRWGDTWFRLWVHGDVMILSVEEARELVDQLGRGLEAHDEDTEEQ